MTSPKEIPKSYTTFNSIQFCLKLLRQKSICFLQKCSQRSLYFYTWQFWSLTAGELYIKVHKELQKLHWRPSRWSFRQNYSERNVTERCFVIAKVKSKYSRWRYIKYIDIFPLCLPIICPTRILQQAGCYCFSPNAFAVYRSCCCNQGYCWEKGNILHMWNVLKGAVSFKV